MVGLENESVQVKVDAERVFHKLPPQIPVQAVDFLNKLFGHDLHEFAHVVFSQLEFMQCPAS